MKIRYWLVLAGASPTLAGAIAPLPGQGTQGQTHKLPAHLVVEPLVAESCDAGPTALVLSGGAAPGLAHIGVIQALEEFDIQIDLIVGTSSGALTGALYASGYSGAELDSMATMYPLGSMLPGYGPRLDSPLNTRPPLIALEERGGRLRPNFWIGDERRAYRLLNEVLLRGNVAARGDFDALPIRFRAVATDFSQTEPVVLESGDLVRAVRASLSIPLVFPPVEIDGRLLVDGGLSANIPVDVARKLGATHVIISDATEHIVELDLQSPVAVLRRIISQATKQAVHIGPTDIFIRPDMDGLPRMDFSETSKDVFVERGRQAAVRELRRKGCFPKHPAGGPGNGAPVAVHRVDAQTQLYRPEITDLSREKAMSGAAILFDRCKGDPSCAGVVLNPTADGDSAVRLEPEILRVPRRVVALGAAYVSGWGARAWLGAMDRGFLGGSLVGSGVVAWSRLQQELEVGLRTSRPALGEWTLVATASLARESIQNFNLSGVTELLPATHMGSLSIGLENDLGSGWAVRAGPEAHLWNDMEGTWHDPSFGLGLRIARQPADGGPSVETTTSVTSGYKRIEVDGRWPIDVGGSRVTPQVRLGWGDRLPLMKKFKLGGPLGFPGLQLGEGLADSQALFRLGASHALAGPMRVTAELAAAAHRSHLSPGRAWLGGARLGLLLETVVGPAAIEYGRTNDGRGAWLIRLGKWF